MGFTRAGAKIFVKGKKIALLGFAYKPDTSDCRQSPAIDIAQAMLAEGARLAIYDPQVSAESITAALGDHSSLQVCSVRARAPSDWRRRATSHC